MFDQFMTTWLYNVMSAWAQYGNAEMNQPLPFQRTPAGVTEFLAGASVLCFLAAAALCGFFLLWLFTVIDIMRSDFKVPTNKITWLLLIIFIAPLGVLLYWIIGSNQKIEPPDSSEVDISYRGRRHD
jgi:hypothetical protein